MGFVKKKAGNFPKIIGSLLFAAADAAPGLSAVARVVGGRMVPQFYLNLVR